MMAQRDWGKRPLSGFFLFVIRVSIYKDTTGIRRRKRELNDDPCCFSVVQSTTI